jgi:hypothetical protein
VAIDLGASPVAMMFPVFVQKIRQTLTFLAAIEREGLRHENDGYYFSPGAAHDIRGGLYRPNPDKRSADHTSGELKPALEAGFLLGFSLGATLLSLAHKPAGCRFGIADRFASLGRGIFQPCSSANDHRIAFGKDDPSGSSAAFEQAFPLRVAGAIFAVACK